MGAVQYGFHFNGRRCTGCTEPITAGSAPVCAEACPSRALGFGPIDEVRERFGDRADLPPLPEATVTAPHLAITLPACAEADPGRVRAEGRVQNGREIV